MKIDWKTVSKSPGYVSLKHAYITDVVNTCGRPKQKLYKHFLWVIGRAKHYANNTGEPIDSILNDWESKRKYCWLNYYQNCRQPLFNSGSIKAPMEKTRYKTLNPKPRWSMDRKKRGY